MLLAQGGCHSPTYVRAGGAAPTAAAESSEISAALAVTCKLNSTASCSDISSGSSSYHASSPSPPSSASPVSSSAAQPAWPMSAKRLLALSGHTLHGPDSYLSTRELLCCTANTRTHVISYCSSLTGPGKKLSCLNVQA